MLLLLCSSAEKDRSEKKAEEKYSSLFVSLCCFFLFWNWKIITSIFYLGLYYAIILYTSIRVKRNLEESSRSSRNSRSGSSRRSGAFFLKSWKSYDAFELLRTQPSDFRIPISHKIENICKSQSSLLLLINTFITKWHPKQPLLISKLKSSSLDAELPFVAWDGIMQYKC